MFTAYYDRRVSPATYDIVAFLCHLEADRIRRGEDAVRIVVPPGPDEGFRCDNLWPHEVSERRLMLEQVALPMAGMLPRCTGVFCPPHRPDRAEPDSIGFGTRLYGLKRQIAAMREGVRPLRPSTEWEPDPRRVTITLREAEHWPERNSNTAQWLEAAIVIRERGFEVIIVRETSKAEGRFGDFQTSPAASICLDTRAQLYRSSACNLFVSNGPAWFSLALDAPVLMLKPAVDNLMSTCSAGYLERCGIPKAGQIPGSPKYQRIVWAEDTAPAIVTAFDAFMTD